MVQFDNGLQRIVELFFHAMETGSECALIRVRYYKYYKWHLVSGTDLRLPIHLTDSGKFDKAVMVKVTLKTKVGGVPACLTEDN